MSESLCRIFNQLGKTMYSGHFRETEAVTYIHVLYEHTVMQLDQESVF